jgi:hypothetical protein
MIGEILATISQHLIDVGILAGVIASVITTIGLITRIRPVKWIWRTMFVIPLARWQREQIEHVVEPLICSVRQELRPNGGTSFDDRVTKQVGGLGRRMDEIEGRTERSEVLLNRICRKLDLPGNEEDASSVQNLNYLEE